MKHIPTQIMSLALPWNQDQQTSTATMENSVEIP